MSGIYDMTLAEVLQYLVLFESIESSEAHGRQTRLFNAAPIMLEALLMWKEADFMSPIACSEAHVEAAKKRDEAINAATGEE